MIYKCAKCGSTDVQRLKLCWVPANEGEPEVDHESDPGVFYKVDTWCGSCDHATTILQIDDRPWIAPCRQVRKVDPRDPLADPQLNPETDP